MMKPLLALLLAFALVACAGEQKPPVQGSKAPAPGGKPSGDASGDHGEAVALGSLTLCGSTFAITRLGAVVPGKEAAFEVAFAGDSKGKPMAAVSLFLWLENKESAQLSAPAKGDIEGDKWHLHAVPREGAGDPVRVTLRVRADGKDERGALPLSGHGHEHGESPHHGVVAILRGPGGAEGGHLELKLHDDKGDLELWIAKDPKIAEPLDLPMEANIRVVFIDHSNREVTLAVRNRDKNEDEEGTANLRGGKTNYFIFPGETGADAKWLQGKQFQSIVRVSFEWNGEAFVSEEFMLVPHTHDGEEGH